MDAMEAGIGNTTLPMLPEFEWWRWHSGNMHTLATVAPAGVNIENDVSHADVVILEQELLELVDDRDVDFDLLVELFWDDDFLFVLVDLFSSEDELLSSFSSCRSSPSFARVSVKSSTSPRSISVPGGGLIASVMLERTSVAQAMSAAIAPTAFAAS
jgi:hypothetical protein